MKVSKLLFALLVIAALALLGSSADDAHATPAGQKQHSAPQGEVAQFHYVCPMHPEVTSSSRGKCPKCKMVLVKKRIPKKSDKNSVAGVQHSH